MESNYNCNSGDTVKSEVKGDIWMENNEKIRNDGFGILENDLEGMY